MSRWIRVFGTRTGTIALALLAGIALRASSMTAGLRGDDFVQVAMLDGTFPGERAAWDLFRFAGPGASDNAPLVDFGYLPFWRSDELSLAMFRPLPSFLIAADHALFGESAVMLHVHSMLWWGAMVLAAGRLLFAALPAGAAGCALVLFAIDESHNLPVAWLANRSTLVATTFALLSVLAQMRAEEHPSVRAHALVWTCLLLAVLSGEYAFSALGYPIAYAVLRPGSPARRLRAVAAPILVGVGYVALRAVIEHGVRDSGYYLSPFGDPLGYLREAGQRVPVLMAELVFGLPAIEWFNGVGLRTLLLRLGPLGLTIARAFPDLRVVHAAVGYLALGVALGLLAWHFRGARAGVGRALLWLLLGAMLGLFPAAAAIPEDRVTVAASLGISALLGSTLARAASTIRARGLVAAPWLLAIAAVAVVHVGLTATRSYERCQAFALTSRTRMATSLRADLPTYNAARTRVYLFGAPDFTTAANLPFARHHAGLPLPLSYRRLSGSRLTHDLTRVDPHRLRVVSHGGAVPGTMTGSLYRPLHKPIERGDTFSLPGLKVQIESAWKGNPVRLLYTFDQPLDDPRMWFVHATHDGLRRLTMPTVGNTVQLEPAHSAW